MKRPNLFRQRRWLLVIAALAAPIYLGGLLWSAASKSGPQTVAVTNRTMSCEVLSAQRHKDRLRLVIRNNSKQKSMTAFAVSFAIDPRTVFTFKEDFAYSETQSLVVPGGTYETTVSLPSSLARRSEISPDFSAAIFDDRSSEGDLRVVQAIQEERLGEKIQFTRVIALLDKMMARSDSEMLRYFRNGFRLDIENSLNPTKDDVLAQVKEERNWLLSDVKPVTLTEGIREGLRTAKESLSRKLQSLETELQSVEAGRASRAAFLGIKQSYERIVNML